MDESKDILDTAQLTVFFDVGKHDFTVFEKFLRLIRLSGTTTGADVCEAVVRWLEDDGLDLSCLHYHRWSASHS